MEENNHVHYLGSRRRPYSASGTFSTRRASPWAGPLSIAANLLRGKHKTDFTPNVDCGDFVIIINTDQGHSHRQEAGAEDTTAVTPAGSAA